MIRQRVPLATLDVDLNPTCKVCEESSCILQEVAPDFPDVAIHCFSIYGDNVPDNVFATPTYVLNGKIIYLGNPTRDALRAKLAEVTNHMFQVMPAKTTKPTVNAAMFNLNLSADCL